MYGIYLLFYESHKNLGYYAHVQTVSTRPLFGGDRPWDEAKMVVVETIWQLHTLIVINF